MGGFFGVASKDDCVFDLFFGTDYHSHLGPAGYMNIDTESIDGKYYGIFRNICNFSLNKCYHVSAHLSLTVV